MRKPMLYLYFITIYVIMIAPYITRLLQSLLPTPVGTKFRMKENEPIKHTDRSDIVL